MRLSYPSLLLTGLASTAVAIGQQPIIGFGSDVPHDAFRLAGGSVGSGQILVSEDDYWGVIRAAGDLATDFGRVTGTEYTLSNGLDGARPAEFKYKPVDTRNNTHYATLPDESLYGPEYSDPDASQTVIIAGTIGSSTCIDELIRAGKIDVSEIQGKWEAFVSKVVKNPIPGCDKALVIAGSMPRGTIYGIYDISEQIGVSPWHYWADVPTKKNSDIFALQGQKTQGPPSVKYRGFFLNDEAPALTNWVAANWPDAWNGSAGFNHHFYALISELLLRLRANYLWPAVWTNMFYTDDAVNQPLVFAYEVVLGSSHTEPLMRAQNEWSSYYTGDWAYNVENKTIDEYFRYGVQRAKPYLRNSLFTMAMRGEGDSAIQGLGNDAIISLLQTVVETQREIMMEVLEVEDLSEIPQLWCLYKEVQSYAQQGLQVPDDVTLLWSDDNWGDIRRMPLKNETSRAGGAGVYYHFDYVGGVRDYKWINTVQLEKTAEQMHMAYARQANNIWIVNVGDLKPLELPLSHFLDISYDMDRWSIDDTQVWLRAWTQREFGFNDLDAIMSILTRYGMYSARRKFELISPETYSVISYNEVEAVLEQWSMLEDDAQEVYRGLDEAYRAPFFEMILHPILAGNIVHEIYFAAAKNHLYAFQKRNSANAEIERALELFEADAQLAIRWDKLLDGKWAHMMDQTHLGYDDYWQQPMRDALPAMRYIQKTFTSLAGHARVGVEGSQAAVPGDDRFHPNEGNELAVPPMDRFGPVTRYFEVFSTGLEACEWKAAHAVPWIALSQYGGIVGPKGSDTRVFISVDWDEMPKRLDSTIVNVSVTTCMSFGKYRFKPAVIQVPIITRSLPSNFTNGFVESDGHVAIEAAHYQSIAPSRSPDAPEEVAYRVFENYGRTSAGVGIYPPHTEKIAVNDAPALQYEMYLFSDNSTAAVTLFLSPSLNYLGDWEPLEYAVALYPASEPTPTNPKTVRFVGPLVGAGLPEGWNEAVADAVWGVGSNTSTTEFNTTAEGAYTLKIWCLLPSVIVQKVVVDLGGVRSSYLGPPESFLVGRDELGTHNGTTFLTTPGTLGGVRGKASWTSNQEHLGKEENLGKSENAWGISIEEQLPLGRGGFGEL